jgi:hypothetical protein
MMWGTSVSVVTGLSAVVSDRGLSDALSTRGFPFLRSVQLHRVVGIPSGVVVFTGSYSACLTARATCLAEDSILFGDYDFAVQESDNGTEWFTTDPLPF